MSGEQTDSWKFYGRNPELERLTSILQRQRWFFAKITGRRRIGKTSLVQEALKRSGRERVLYLQVPDSDPAGVLATARDFYEVFAVPGVRPTDLRGLAQDISRLVRAGWVVALDEFQELTAAVDDLDVLHEMAREVDDATQEPELADGISRASKQLRTLELRSLFTGEHDEVDCIVQINAKDGGVDAQDWSELLLRMYTRWAERRGFTVELSGISEGTEAGILSADFTIHGRYAYGLMTSERGTHRLVRISPFDNQGRRQTSFATVQVWPVMDAPDLEVNESEIRMEVFRASGAGGQHVNKTSSAVRLIHEPTGAVASSQEERSQLQNREKALTRLKAMIVAKIEEEHQAAQDAIAGKPAQSGWGSQIRSYVLQPYQMVKDHRTGHQTLHRRDLHGV